MAPMPHIVVIEDEPGIADFVSRGLRGEGFDVTVAHDGVTGEQAAVADGVDLVVLDLMLPRRSGTEVLQALVGQRPGLPVIVLTARGEVRERVLGLEAGAVDYVVKPFSLSELAARIRAQLRMASLAPTIDLRTGPLRLDRLSRQVTHDGHPVRLSTTEFDLLAQLMHNAGRVLSRTQIQRAVWGYEHDPGTNIVDVYIGYLRRKLGVQGRTPVQITAVRSRGYRLEDGE